MQIGLVYKVFELENPKVRSLYLKIEGEQWYLLHRMRDNYIYLADNPSIDKSTRIRFIKWEEVLQKELFIDGQKSGTN